jgi:hypothetical protein
VKQSRAQAFIFEVKFEVNFIFKSGTHCAARLSGLPLSKVRSEGRPSRSPVLQEIITLSTKPCNRNGCRVFFLQFVANGDLLRIRKQGALTDRI